MLKLSGESLEGLCFVKRFREYGEYRGIIAQYHSELEPNAYVGRYSTGIDDDENFDLIQLRKVMQHPSTTKSNGLKRCFIIPGIENCLIENTEKTTDETTNTIVNSDAAWWNKEGKTIDIRVVHPDQEKEITQSRELNNARDDAIHVPVPKKKKRKLNTSSSLDTSQSSNASTRSNHTQSDDAREVVDCVDVEDVEIGLSTNKGRKRQMISISFHSGIKRKDEKKMRNFNR